MAITQAVCTSFKQELLVGTHDFTATTGDTFKIALYTFVIFLTYLLHQQLSLQEEH